MKLQVFPLKVALLWGCLVHERKQSSTTLKYSKLTNNLQLSFYFMLWQVLGCTFWHHTDAEVGQKNWAENPKLWKRWCRVRRLKAHWTCSWLSLQIPKWSYGCQDLDRANVVIGQHKRDVSMSMPGTLLVKVKGLVQILKQLYWFLADLLVHIMLQGPPVFKNFCVGFPVSHSGVNCNGIWTDGLGALLRQVKDLIEDSNQ